MIDKFDFDAKRALAMNHPSSRCSWNSRFSPRQIGLWIVLAVLALLTLAPFMMTILISQKSNAELYADFLAMPRRWGFDPFLKAYPFIKGYIYNSLLICGISTLLTLLISSLSGYVFARIRFDGKETLFVALLALMMVPGILTLAPSFLWYKEFPFVGGNNWLGSGGEGFFNTRLILIIPYVAGGQIIGIFLCRTFFEGIPESFFESARIDGANELQCYMRIALPLSLPILMTLAIMNFIGIYNDYIWPLVAIKDSNIQVFAVGVTRFNMDGYLDEQAPIMAGYLLGSIPPAILFAVGMKYYVEGLTKGGIKA